jgi:hypothetical protein
VNVALLGCGNRMRQDLPAILRGGANVAAVCDVFPYQFKALNDEAAKHGAAGKSVAKAKVYGDYRKLLDAEKSVEAVVIAAGNRWHAPLSKASLLAGKHVFCEKPLCHSAVECREMGELGAKTKLAQQIGSQGGASNTFRRAMEVIQAGVLGQIREVHCWINRTFPASAPLDLNADPIPEGLDWDFWCGPSKLLPFKQYYLGVKKGDVYAGGCLPWGRWLEFGDGHLCDMGAHAFNLPWRALKLGTAQRVSVKSAEPLKDSYPSANTFRWDFPARGDLPAVAAYWHDGPTAGPPAELAKELIATYGSVPNSGVLFAGEKGLLRSDAWGVGGVVKLKDDTRFRGVQDHAACKPVPVTLPRAKDQNHMLEWLDACRGKTTTFQPFETASPIAEITVTGIITLRLGKPIEWDSAALKVKGVPEADPLIRREPRTKWL